MKMEMYSRKRFRIKKHVFLYKKTGTRCSRQIVDKDLIFLKENQVFVAYL